jgi:hypothetical protein
MKYDLKPKFIANLGSKAPLQGGGLFVYIDEAGIFAPMAVKILPVNIRHNLWYEYRWVLENLTLYTIKDQWFYDSLLDASSLADSSWFGLVSDLVDGSPQAKAIAWDALGYYHGYDRLDSHYRSYNGEVGRQQLEIKFAKEFEMIEKGEV